MKFYYKNLVNAIKFVLVLSFIAQEDGSVKMWI